MRKRVTSHLKNLFVPYISWNVISVLWAIVLETVPFFSNNITGTRERFEFSLINILQGIFFYKYQLTFWFVFLLLFFVLLTPLIWILVKNKYVGIVSILILSAMYQSGLSPLFFMRHLFGVREKVLIYYLIGAYVGMHFYEQFISIEYQKTELAVSLCLIAYLVLTQNFEAFVMTDSIRIFLFGSSLWVIISCLPPRLLNSDCFALKISFFIYALHPYVQPCINKLIWIICPHTDFWALFNLIGGVLITLGIVFAIAWVMTKNKYLNYIWGLLNGGRGKM